MTSEPVSQYKFKCICLGMLLNNRSDVMGGKPPRHTDDDFSKLMDIPVEPSIFQQLMTGKILPTKRKSVGDPRFPLCNGEIGRIRNARERNDS